MTFLPDNLIEWVGFFVAASGGVLAFYYAFSKEKRILDKESSGIKDDIIGDYKERLEQVEGKVESQKARIKDLETKVITLESSNSTMREIFQGIDKSSVEYREKGLKAMENGDRAMEVLKNLVDGQKSMLGAINKQSEQQTKLYSLIEKHLDNESKMIDNTKK